LRAAGVPRPVIRMLAPFRPRARSAVLGAWAAAVVRAGAAPLVRADIAVRPGLARRPEAAALDVADGRVADGPALIADLGGEVGTEHWWYAVAALGLLRRSDAVPGLLAAFRKIGAPAPETAAARGVVIRALTTVLTGSERTWSWSAGPAPERSWAPLLLELAADPDDQLAGMSVGLLARLRDSAHQPVFLAVVGDAARRPGAAAIAVNALAAMDVVEAAGALTAMLTDPSVRALWPREHAARALSRLGRADVPAAVAALEVALRDEQPAVRWHAARALADLGGPAAVDALLRNRGQDAAWALGRLRPARAVPVLMEWLRSARQAGAGWPAGQVVMIRACAEALDAIGAPEAAPLLAEAAGDARPEIRRAALWALARTDPDAGVDALLLNISDPDASVRREAARGLAGCRDPRAVAGLVAGLRDDASRRIALRAFVARPDPRAVPGLLGALAEAGDLRTRRLAGVALVAVAPTGDVLGGVEEILRTGGARQQRAALAVLGALGRGSSYLVSVRIDDADEITRARAAAALGRLEPPDDSWSGRRVGRRLISAAGDPVPRVRANAVTALGRWGRAEDVPVLRSALDDPHPSVRAAAASAVSRETRDRPGADRAAPPR
jgi:HEAT repeat protein